MVMIPQEIIGTIPGWITSASTVALLGLVARYKLGLRKLSNADVADLRDHYAEELNRNGAMIKELRDRLDAADRRYLDYQKIAEERWTEANRRDEECRREKAEMREEIDGLKRQLIRYSADQALLLHLDAPEAKASVPRVRKIVGRK